MKIKFRSVNQVKNGEKKNQSIQFKKDINLPLTTNNTIVNNSVLSNERPSVPFMKKENKIPTASKRNPKKKVPKNEDDKKEKISYTEVKVKKDNSKYIEKLARPKKYDSQDIISKEKEKKKTVTFTKKKS